MGDSDEVISGAEVPDIVGVGPIAQRFATKAEEVQNSLARDESYDLCY